MTEKEKIRSEIERLKAIADYQLENCKVDKSAWSQQVEVCEKLLSFIDSLQEEPKPKFKVGQIITDGKETVIVSELLDDGSIRVDTKPSGDCWFDIDVNEADKWRLVEEPVSEDLEEELDRYLPSVFSKDMDGGNPRFTTWFKALRKTALHFTIWQKQQIMKDAVDAFIYKGGIRLKEWPLPEKCGEHLDSVKVIIIKED